MNQLWGSFRSVATGFGLDPVTFRQVCAVLPTTLSTSEALPLPEDDLDELCAALFAAFDTDSNSNVDSLEFLATLTLCSAMPEGKKLELIFQLCVDADS